MLIVCPACASEYEIEAERVGEAGRTVRCAGCRETWFVTAAATQEPAAVDPWEAIPGAEGLDDTPAALQTLDQPVPSPANGKPARSGTKAPTRRSHVSPALAAGLALLACLPLALLGRASLVQAMPRSAALFSAVGLPVNLRGIALVDVAAFRNPAEGGKPGALVVEGILKSVSDVRA